MTEHKEGHRKSAAHSARHLARVFVMLGLYQWLADPSQDYAGIESHLSSLLHDEEEQLEGSDIRPTDFEKADRELFTKLLPSEGAALFLGSVLFFGGRKMRRGEFQIIDRFFTHDAFGEWRSQGVGDDCAIIDMPGNRIAVTTDMMAVGTHFLPGARPEDIGYKALAVNLSDLAAAGASPRAFFLSIGLPERDDEWLAGFSRGLMALAESSGCALLGGDTTRTAEVGGTHAPVTISITAMGSLPEGKGLTRAGAKPGDDIWVSGTVGDAYAALKHRWGHWQLMPDAAEALFPRMDRPTPRNMLGSALLDLATACADVSDGLLADLGHILERSGVSGSILWEAVPVSSALRALSPAAQQEAALTGGDDYELVFTAPPSAALRIEQAGLLTKTRLTRIGKICEKVSGDNLTVRSQNGGIVTTPTQGFDHFAA